MSTPTPENEPVVNPVTGEGRPPRFEPTNVDESGAWVFRAPGHEALANAAETEKARKLEAIANEPGDGPGTYEDRKEMIPHPWSQYFRSVHMGDKMPPLNLPPELHHFLAWQIDRLGFRHHPELQLELYQDPPGPKTVHNPGKWVPREEYVAPEIARMAAAPVTDLPDFSGMEPHHLEEMKRQIRNEEVRRLQEKHTDIHTKVGNGTAEMPEIPIVGARKTPPPPKPIPNPNLRPRETPTPPPAETEGFPVE